MLRSFYYACIVFAFLSSSGFSQSEGGGNFNELSYELDSIDKIDALTAIRNLQELSAIKVLKKGSFAQFKMNLLLAKAYSNIGRIDTSNFILSSLINEKEDERLQALIYHQLALNDTKTGNLTEAANLLKTIYSIYDKYQCLRNKTIVLKDLGNVYFYSDNIESAQLFYEKALILGKELNDDGVFASIYNNLGRIYIGLNDYETALNYLHLSYDIKVKMDDLLGMANTNINIGKVYEHRTQYLIAESHYKLALNQMQAINNKDGVAKIHHYLGYLYLLAGKEGKAIGFFSTGLKYSLEYGLTKNTLIFHKNLSNVYQKQNDYKRALIHQNAAIQIEDSLNNAESKYKLSLIKSEIEKDNFIDQINALMLENSRKDEKIVRLQRHEYLLFFLILIVSLFFTFLFFRYRLKKRLNVQLETEIKRRNDSENELLDIKRNLEKIVSKRTRELHKAKELAEQANKLKSKFISNISHEVLTPMNAIIGYANLLKDGSLEDEQRHEFIENISKNSHHLIKLIGNLIKTSEIESNQIHFNKNLGDIVSLLNDLEFILKEKAVGLNKDYIKIRFLNKLQLTNFNLYTDHQKLRFILWQILENALKFTNSGKIEFDYVFLKDQSLVLFQVKDTGDGIAPDQQQKIFNKFYKIYSEKGLQPGTGLGLPICKDLVNALGGSMWLDSSDKGSTFYFTLPFIEEEIVRERFLERKADYSVDWSNKNILLVSDAETRILSVKSGLTATGAYVKWVTEKKEFLTYLMENEADLILIDVYSNYYNSKDLVTEIRNFNQHTPLVAIGYQENKKEMDLFIKQGFKCYINYYEEKGQLIAIIKKLFFTKQTTYGT